MIPANALDFTGMAVLAIGIRTAEAFVAAGAREMPNVDASAYRAIRSKGATP